VQVLLTGTGILEGPVRPQTRAYRWKLQLLGAVTGCRWWPGGDGMACCLLNYVVGAKKHRL